MALLRLFVVMLVLVSGCYAPEISDCDVTCTTNDECAGDQVCTPEGLCAGSISACDENAVTDGGTPRTIDLRVKVDGDGKVVIGGGLECDPEGGGPMGDMCTLMVPAGPLVIEAVVGPKPFDKWTSIVCAGQGPRCEVTLTINASVTAKFR
ncbi:MAG: hypothetical protein AB7T06_19185 [Kofleriaceae bacterium]